MTPKSFALNGPAEWEPPLNPERIRDRLARAWERLDAGPPSEDRFQGRLLRPRFAAAMLSEEADARMGDAFEMGALAVQLAHEASLVHDDILDGARTRRGRPTVVARKGVAAALLEGDQLLARSYRAAERTECSGLVRRFTEAVDRTIEGERLQAQDSRASWASRPEWDVRTIARAKSGELFGVALATVPLLRGDRWASRAAEVGRDAGVLYQRVDDLLDYCPGAGTGKPALMDHRQGLWTWPRAYLEEGSPPESLFLEVHGRVPAMEALADLEEEGQVLVAALGELTPHAPELEREIQGWLDGLRSSVEAEVERRRAASGRARPTTEDGGELPGIRRLVQGGNGTPSPDPVSVLAHHGRSFSFASYFLPAEDRERAARVYAFCRLVDDLVDRGADPDSADGILDETLREARAAYEAGHASTGHDLGRVMVEMREAGAPFQWAEELVEGVRMDLRPRTFVDHQELRMYTRRVAGVVGLWMAKLGGVQDPWALEMAEEMGHAMQLTNIVRDVGADLELGRLYLPRELLELHKVRQADLERIRASQEPIPSPFASALEDLMGRADAGYRGAFQALPHLRPGFRKAMAVAARVYQGIHREVRRNGYDTLRRRARTRLHTKAVLALAALRELRSAERRAVSPPAVPEPAATPAPRSVPGSG